jgi:hypothetical protein
VSLDPPLSDAELLARAKARGATIDPLPTAEQLLARAAGKKLTVKPIDCSSGENEPPRKRTPERRSIPRPRGAVTVGKVERHIEGGRIAGIAATIYGAPRTKKNASSGGLWLATPGYKHWCAGIVRGLLPERVTLPEAPLNLEAHFYVDVRGVPADLVGLLQGLCDALQAAEIVTNDNWIRGFDGSRIFYDEQHHPRCQFELCPLQPFEGLDWLFRIEDAATERAVAKVARKTPYTDTIVARLVRMGRKEVDPRHVEAYMRLEHPTLDGLTKYGFTQEMKIALQCIDASTPEDNESCARSFGL